MKTRWLAVLGLVGASTAILGFRAPRAAEQMASATASSAAARSQIIRGVQISGHVPQAVREELRLGRGSAFSKEVVEVDRKTLLEGMRSRGYLNIQVNTELETSLEGDVFVRFSVEQGELYRIERVTAAGMVVDLAALTTLSAREIADANRIERNRMMLESSLSRRLGKAVVVSTQLVVDHGQHSVAVEFVITQPKAARRAR